MVASSPRLSPRLLEAIRRLDDGKLPLAELWRRVGVVADHLELPRPSYERVRLIAHHERALRRLTITTTDVLLDVATLDRDWLDLLRHAAGTLPPPRRSPR